MKVLLTGASGFVGKAVLEAAGSRDIYVRPVFRSQELPNVFDKSDNIVAFVPKIDSDTDWEKPLSDIDVVVHCAALLHSDSKMPVEQLAEFRVVNVGGTVNLAQQAAQAGVKRFVFISSIKVNGEQTLLGRPFVADDPAMPEDAYGISKAEAESGLAEVAKRTEMEVTVIRPPLVYAAEARGNFSTLVWSVATGLPLPLGKATQNRRSLVSIDNLVDFILTCISHPGAGNQTFLVSDGEDLSTAELLRRIGRALNRPVCLVPVSLKLLSFVAKIFGKKQMVQRLLGSLQVDISKNITLLGWRPSVSVDESLNRLARRRA